MNNQLIIVQLITASIQLLILIPAMIEKIKKLLRLAKDKSASPAEAANALGRALKMAKDGGINLDQIDPDEDTGASGVEHSTCYHRGVGIAEILSMHLVCNHFHVEHLIVRGRGNRPRIHFIGSKSAITLAAYAHEYLVGAMRRAWKEQNDKRLKRDAFMHGFIWAIKKQMPEVFKDRSEALVPLFDSYIQDVILSPGAKLKTVKGKGYKPGADASFYKGFKNGNQAGIRNGLDGPAIPQIES